MKINTLSEYLKITYGCKVYKLSLQSGCTCPNRDGTVGTGGCTFCSEGGSGDFAAFFLTRDKDGNTITIEENIDMQIESAKEKVASKLKGQDHKYIAYFQSFIYKVIMSERSINSSAAEIMAKETKTMINATKTLFYALQVKCKADFVNVDSAAISFAMGIHALLDYECDLEHAGMKKDENITREFIDEFCRIYEIGRV